MGTVKVLSLVVEHLPCVFEALGLLPNHTLDPKWTAADIGAAAWIQQRVDLLFQQGNFSYHYKSQRL